MAFVSQPEVLNYRALARGVLLRAIRDLRCKQTPRCWAEEARNWLRQAPDEELAFWCDAAEIEAATLLRVAGTAR